MKVLQFGRFWNGQHGGIEPQSAMWSFVPNEFLAKIYETDKVPQDARTTSERARTRKS